MQSKISKYFQTKPSSSAQVAAAPAAASDAGARGESSPQIATTATVDSGRTESEQTMGVDLANAVFPYSAKKRTQVVDAVHRQFGAEGEHIEQTDGPKLLSAIAAANFTPLEKQVRAIKTNYPDSVLMVECGYRIRFFGEDARVASNVLGIYAHMDHNFLVASFPTYRSLVHCRRLIQAGHKVAIVRQQETAALRKSKKSPSPSNTFERAVVGVFTAGTIVDDDDPAFRGLCALKAPKQTTGSREQHDGSEDDNENDDDEEEKEKEEDYAAIAAEGYDIEDGLEPERKRKSTATDEGRRGESRGNTGVSVRAGHQQSMEVPAEETGKWVGCVFEEAATETIGFVAINVLADKVYTATMAGDPIRQGLKDQLDFLSCVEVVLPLSCSDLTVAVVEERLEPLRTARSARFQPEEARYIKRVVRLQDRHFRTLEGDRPPPSWTQDLSEAALCAVAGLQEYLRGFHLVETLYSAKLSSLSSLHKEQFFHLDGVTARDLEVFQRTGGGGSGNSGSGKKTTQGTLFSLLDKCRTSYGRRTLRSWLSCPLTDRSCILERQQTITALAKDSIPLLEMIVRCCHDIFRDFPDIEKALASLLLGRISKPRMKVLLQLGQQIAELGTVPGNSPHKMDTLPDLVRSWMQAVDWQAIGEKSRRFASMVIWDEPSVGSMTGLFTKEAEADVGEIAQLQQQMQCAQTQLDQALHQARGILRMPTLDYVTLRTGATSKLEHLLEVPVSFSRPIPESWLKMSSTKQVTRFHSPEVLAAQGELYCARDQVKLVADRLWTEFVGTVSKALYSDLRSAVQVLANMDAAMSLARIARQPGYVCPDFPPEGDEVEIRGGKHPMLAKAMEDRGSPFVPNDFRLCRNFQSRSCIVVTGPNMGGKSSYVRTLSLICLLGQLGSYVPAEQARLCVFDNIFTRMGAEDDLSAGRSTFMCELVRTSSILRVATARSLLVIDELGRGTSTHDGCAIALATLRYMVTHVGCALMFITHFPQVADFVDSGGTQDRCLNVHMSYVEEEVEREDSGCSKEIVFLYAAVDGRSKGSYGVNVGRLAGLPNSVLTKATEMSAWMLAKTCESEGILCGEGEEDEGGEENMEDQRPQKRICDKEG